MSQNAFYRTIAGIAFGTLLTLANSGRMAAQEAAPEAQPAGAQAKPVEGVAVAEPVWTPEQLAVIEVSRKFDEAFAKGDIEALMTMFSDDVRIVDENGGVYVGLKEARGLYADGFEKSPGATLKTVVEAVNLVTPDVAVEDGTSIFTPAAGDPVETSYQATYVRKDGKWKLVQLRDFLTPDVIDAGVHSEYLTALSWMEGEWVFEGAVGVITANVAYVDDGNALEIRFLTSQDGQSRSVATVRIGYDPRIKQIKSWTFDSAGGHGFSTWARVGEEDRWLLKNEAVLPDGKTVTASQLFELAENGDKILWTTFDKSIDGVMTPNRDEVVMTRKAPAPVKSASEPAQPEPAKTSQ